jgi:hypothetical protein
VSGPEADIVWPTGALDGVVTGVTDGTGVGVGAMVGVGVGVTVGVGVGVGAMVGVGVGVMVGVGATVGVVVGAGVLVGVGAMVAMGVGAGVAGVVGAAVGRLVVDGAGVGVADPLGDRNFFTCQWYTRTSAERTAWETPPTAATTDRFAWSTLWTICGPATRAFFKLPVVNGLAEARPATAPTVTRPTAMSIPSCFSCTASFLCCSPRTPRQGACPELSAPRAARRDSSQGKGMNLSEAGRRGGAA